MQSFVASSLAVVVVVLVVAWGGVGADARPQTLTETFATPFTAVADATEGAIDSASNFFTDTGIAINR